MLILDIIHLAVWIVFGLPLVYLAMLTLAALTVKLKPEMPSRGVHMRSFAIVVPAHNEAIAIQKTIRSLQAIDYPRVLFEVIVIADNCTDHTAALARTEGATVLERFNTQQRGKGYALRWCFDRLLHDETKRYEAFVVIDADTVVSGNYLSMLTVAIEDGAHVMQTSDLVEPCPGAWTTEALRLAFVLYNYVRPLGRKALGFSAGLRGNGMCFTRQALASVPWQAYSKAEDLEYGLQMLLSGYSTRFVPEAVALATMPQQAVNAESQRARWEGGRLPLIRRYAGPLLWFALRRRSIAALDAFIDLATPAFVNMMAIALGASFLCAVVFVTIAGADAAGMYALVWLGAIVSGVFHVTAGLKVARDPSLVQTVLAIPRYVVWKTLLYVKLARRKKSDEWVRTTRETSGTPPHSVSPPASSMSTEDPGAPDTP
ncbi:MAG TPA: glycosyltransferase family 2 protein [Bacteroidota bacterium]|nr:glycosyltransferase family 2 protein [Bacteroidota bacterium]